MNRDLQPTSTPSFERLGLTSTIDLLDLLWRRKRILAATAVVGILIGLIYYAQATRTYESHADVLIVQKRPEVVTGNQRYESGFEDYVTTHLTLIKSRLIIERAIEARDLGSLKTFAWVDPEEYDLAEVISEQLTVTGGPRDLGDNADRIMTLGFEGTEPEECPIVVEAVLNAYKAFLGEIYEGMSEDTMKLIEEARSLLQNDLQTQEEAYTQFRQESPLVSRGTDEVNPLQDRLTTIETQRSELLIRRAEFEGQLQTIQNAQNGDFDSRQLIALVTDLRGRATTGDASTNVPATLNSQLVQLADQEQQLLEHFGPNHPHVATMRQRIAATRQILALPTTSYMQEPGETGEPGTESDADPVKLYREFLEQELESIKISEQLLTELYQREHEVAKELSGYQLKDETFRRNMDRTQQLYDGVISQLQDASLIRGYGGFEARVIANPLLGEKVSPSGKIVLPVSLFAGFCVGFLMAVVAELKDKSFHSRREIQTRLGLSVLAQIPWFEAMGDAERDTADKEAKHDAKFDRMLCVYFHPRSPQTEAFRNLRTSLLFNHRHEACRLIQLTSPGPDDGASTIAANLAVSIAQLDKRVLLIDANPHRPRQLQIFGIDPEAAGSSTFTAGRPLSEAIQQTAIDNLWLLPVGLLVTDGSELFASAQFTKFLTSVREEYDVVLIDTEPLLAVSDSCVVASQVDGVVMALRPTKDSRWRAERAKEVLDGIGVQPLGLVVNGVGGTDARAYRDESSDYEQVQEGAVHGSP